MGQKTKGTIGRERMERERSGLQSGFEGDFYERNGKNEKYNLDELRRIEGEFSGRAVRKR